MAVELQYSGFADLPLPRLEKWASLQVPREEKAGNWGTRSHQQLYLPNVLLGVVKPMWEV